MFVDEEHFHLVQFAWVSDAEDEKLHDFVVDVWRIDISQINLESDF